MSVFRNLFRLLFCAQKQNRLTWGLAILFCLGLTFLISPAVLLSYWIVCFLLLLSTINTFSHEFPLCLPITRRQLVLSHYLYCLLLNLATVLLFWAVSLINPWKPGSGLSYTLPLVIFFSLSLPYYGVGLNLYYRGYKYMGLFLIAYYLIILGAVNHLNDYLSPLLSPVPAILCLTAGLLFYGCLAFLSCRFFAQKDIL